jgi:hypothetical protein
MQAVSILNLMLKFDANKPQLKEYPIVGACDLNCNLCPKYYT